MCTLIIARNLWRFYPLVIAANRDEDLRRPARPPEIWEGEPRILAPVDEKAGGTWIGVSEYGVFAAVTNRDDVPDEERSLSRGQLVVTALESDTPDEAVGRLSRLGPDMFNGFNLVIADRREAWLMTGNGRDLLAKPLDDGLTVVTSIGIGRIGKPADHVPGLAMRRADRVAIRARRTILKHPPRASNLTEWLDLHDPERDGATCHHGTGDGWGTRSSTVVRMDREMTAFEMWHREGRPYGGACGERWEGPLRLTLA